MDSEKRTDEFDNDKQTDRLENNEITKLTEFKNKLDTMNIEFSDIYI